MKQPTMIPKYVKEMMQRSRYEFDSCTKSEQYAAGYTIRVRKATAYTNISTLRAEVERLCKWANRVSGCETAFVLDMPTKTHHCQQSAVLTIFDPVMQRIEKYIT